MASAAMQDNAAEATKIPLSNLYDSLEVAKDEYEHENSFSAESNASSISDHDLQSLEKIAPAYTPQVVFRVKLDESELHFQSYPLVTETVRLLAHLQRIWKQCDDGDIHQAQTTVLTEAAVELIGEQEKKLMEHLSTHAFRSLPEYTGDAYDALTLAGITLMDVRETRNFFAGHLLPLEPFSQRHPEIRAEEAAKSDDFLIQYTMDLNLKTVRNTPIEKKILLLTETGPTHKHMGSRAEGSNWRYHESTLPVNPRRSSQSSSVCQRWPRSDFEGRIRSGYSSKHSKP
jgi:hypothetical protein